MPRFRSLLGAFVSAFERGLRQGEPTVQKVRRGRLLSGSAAAFDLGASQGAAVLGLLERTNVPPVPALYRLIYDYVAGVRGLLTSRVDDILGEGGDVAGRLYTEFVAPYETNETLERAAQRITQRLRALDVLIRESLLAAEEQSTALRGAGVELNGDQIGTALLREWVERLEATNRGMRRSTTKLERELIEATTELRTMRDEIHLVKENLTRDPLTGLANRSGLDAAMQRAMIARGNSGRLLTCAMVDIDHFKSLNDRYGHQVGDEVLRIVARAILVSVRGGDIVGRPGGDEFLVIFPDAGLTDARELGERIRTSVTQSDLRAVMGEAVLGGITASIGVALHHEGDTITGLVERADGCLYQAKQGGRNRVICEGDVAG
jgi:diguanylate cyclase